MSLKDVFQSMNLTTYDLTVDMLDVHADRNTFHRFDKFNSKYNPIGESRLREVFLKTDNYSNGKYFAQIIKVSGEGTLILYIWVFFKLYFINIFFLTGSCLRFGGIEIPKYRATSLHLWQITGWVEEVSKMGHRIQCAFDKCTLVDTDTTTLVSSSISFSHFVALFLIPLSLSLSSDIFKSNNLMNSFQNILDNIFKPLFEVTSRPSEHPNLHRFLNYVIGFDSVDDESKPENPIIDLDIPTPEAWSEEENPPYAYYIYYMYANMTVLNQYRK